MAPANTKALQNTREKKSSSATRLRRSLWPQNLISDADNYPFREISPDLHLRHNARAKRLALRLDVKKRVVFLVIPKRVSLRNAYKFAREHQNWIRDRIDELPQQITFTDGNVIPLFGKKYVVDIRYDNTLRKTDIQLIK